MTSTITEYTPRHSWGAVRLSTSHAQLSARLTVVDAVGEPETQYIGRHREDLPHSLNLPHSLDCPLCRLVAAMSVSS